MDGLMTEGTILTLILIVSAVLMVGAAFVVVVGGRPARDRTRPRLRHIKPKRPKAA